MSLKEICLYNVENRKASFYSTVNFISEIKNGSKPHIEI